MLHATHNKLANSRGGVNACKWLRVKARSAPFGCCVCVPYPCRHGDAFPSRAFCWRGWDAGTAGQRCADARVASEVGLRFAALGCTFAWSRRRWSSSTWRLWPLLLETLLPKTPSQPDATEDACGLGQGGFTGDHRDFCSYFSRVVVLSCVCHSSPYSSDLFACS